MKHWLRRILLVSAILLTFPYSALAITTLSAKTIRAVVFKDGYCMVIKEVRGRIDSDCRALLKEIPSTAVLGSFWVQSSDGKPVSMVVRQKIVPQGGKNVTEKEIEFSFDSKTPEGEVLLSLSYFGPGIRWIPTYRVELEKKETAKLLMQAEILNELEDLENIPLDLVVGVPNFRFRDVVSPMSLEGKLANNLQNAAPQLMAQSMSNTMTQRAGEFRGSYEMVDSSAENSIPALPASLSGEGAQDLYIYNVPKVTLRAGERAAISIINSSVPIKHIYTWDVDLQRSGIEGSQVSSARLSPVRLMKNDIWHQIEITNNIGLPITTGAAMVMQGPIPIAQELLTYTSVGNKAQLPLTVAVDLRGTYEEEEVSREANALNFDGNSYVQITKKGSLSVTNAKKEDVEILINTQFGGNCTEASDNGAISISDYSENDWGRASGHKALVGHSNVRWQKTIKAGETIKLSCVYNYFTR